MESFRTWENNDDSVRPERRPVEFSKLEGGPFKLNDLLTERLGLEEALPYLDVLKVPYKHSRYTPGPPEGFRIEILDPENNENPAPEDYVRYVYEYLRERHVSIDRAVTRTLDEPGADSVNNQ